MGYTHYFKQKKAPTTLQWKHICDDFRRWILAAMLTRPFPIQREDDNSAPPEITDEHIIFNGIGDDAHETMFLSCEETGFQFCKTAHKPYDRAVMVLLILAHHYAPDVWEISSDGDAADWQPTLTWMREHSLIHYALPPRISGEEIKA